MSSLLELIARRRRATASRRLGPPPTNGTAPAPPFGDTSANGHDPVNGRDPVNGHDPVNGRDPEDGWTLVALGEEGDREPALDQGEEGDREPALDQGAGGHLVMNGSEPARDPEAAPESEEPAGSTVSGEPDAPDDEPDMLDDEPDMLDDEPDMLEDEPAPILPVSEPGDDDSAEGPEGLTVEMAAVPESLAATALEPALLDPTPPARAAIVLPAIPRYATWLPGTDLLHPERSRALAPTAAGLPVPVAQGATRARERAQMRRRVRYLRHLRELQLRDLGGFQLEAHRLGAPARLEIVEAKIAVAAQTDQELRALERALHGRVPLRDLREPGIGGACAHCGAVHGVDDRFCAACGASVASR